MPEKQYFTGIDVINAPRIEGLTVTEDGTYTASSDVIGYNPVVVNTNQPWQPLQDGYSNFWFELTNDTLHTCDTQASIATDNSIISPGSSFYNLKDFGTNFVTQIKSVNATTNKYVIQPLIAFGVKTPLYLITGAYSANPPLFTEFTYGNDTYLVVGTNYCIKI